MRRSTSKKAAITIDDGSDDNDSTVGVSTRSGKGRASAASSSDAGDVVIVQSASSSYVLCALTRLVTLSLRVKHALGQWTSRQGEHATSQHS